MQRDDLAGLASGLDETRVVFVALQLRGLAVLTTRMLVPRPPARCGFAGHVPPCLVERPDGGKTRADDRRVGLGRCPDGDVRVLVCGFNLVSCWLIIMGCP